MIPEEIIKTVREVIPHLSKPAIIAKLEHGLKRGAVSDPKQIPFYKFCSAIESLDLQSIENRTALISQVAVKSGLSTGYVSTTFNQTDIALPEHLSGYTRKTRGPVVAGVKTAEPKRKNPHATILSIDRTLKERLEEYAERHNKSVKEVAETALKGFLEAGAEVKKRGRQ